MLTNGVDLLKVANEHNFAVPAFNISDWAMFKGCIEVCEEKRAPWIIAIHPDELSHVGTSLLPAIIDAAWRTSVPTVIHLDHGATYEQVLTAIQAGFTSAMIDKSMLPFDENVAITKRVVETAHAVGLSVEGELGTIGTADNEGEYVSSSIIYTTPEDAVRFVEQTGVDSLAVAIGTSHGLYPSDKKPELALDLLREIKAVLPIPLVLHGGSANPDTEIAQAVKLGINKINISSDFKVAYHDRMREVMQQNPGMREPNRIQPLSMVAMKEVCAQKIDLFGAAGKAELYHP